MPNGYPPAKSGIDIEILKTIFTEEEAGLVHMTSNFKSGHFYICNCCKCCCGPLSKYISISKNAAAKSNYIAVVDNARCIACGICMSTSPEGAIRLEKRKPEDMQYVPANDREWMELRARSRGISDDYKKKLF